ncbi:MAG: EAL domain-containing protein [Parvularculaceae bacterium]
MIAVGVFGVSESVTNLAQLELIRGAVAGAFIVACAFLAGYAAIRRSGLAVTALLMVMSAAALEFSWLQLFPALSSEITVLLQAAFAASAIVFLSASIGAARYNPLLGGVMFTAALVLGGMGVINLLDRIDLAQLMRASLVSIGGFAVVLSAWQAFRGDSGARLILPGVALAAAAPLIGMAAADSAAMTFASHAMFTLGVLAASIIALTESSTKVFTRGVAHASFHDHGHHPNHPEHSAACERADIDLSSQIARVLDYSGVGIWDWSRHAVDQTESLPALLGADSNAPFTPDALRNFIHADDAPRFDADVLSPIDGPFDSILRLFDGRIVRIRGARAADEKTGEIERLVAFIENADPTARLAGNGVNTASLKSATEAAIVPAAAAMMTGKVAAALEKGDIVAAFQPIVALDGDKVAGYEALARWKNQDNGADEGPEQFVRAAERAGQGGVLAKTMLQQSAAFLADALKTERRKDLFVAINVSWGQIREEGFIEAVREAISSYDLPKKSLVLELTEADAVTDSSLAADVFRRLKDSGVALAFDDFGAGFTCLSNLRKYEFDYIKIDQSVTADLEQGGDSAKIAAAIAGLGRDLGLKVIAEGIESKAAAHKAKQIGCAYGQGYALGKPAAPVIVPVKAEPPVAVVEAEEKPAEQKKKFFASKDKPAKADLTSEPTKAPKKKGKDEAKLSAVEEPAPVIAEMPASDDHHDGDGHDHHEHEEEARFEEAVSAAAPAANDEAKTRTRWFMSRASGRR